MCCPKVTAIKTVLLTQPLKCYNGSWSTVDGSPIRLTGGGPYVFADNLKICGDVIIGQDVIGRKRQVKNPGDRVIIYNTLTVAGSVTIEDSGEIVFFITNSTLKIEPPCAPPPGGKKRVATDSSPLFAVMGNGVLTVSGDWTKNGALNSPLIYIAARPDSKRNSKGCVQLDHLRVDATALPEETVTWMLIETEDACMETTDMPFHSIDASLPGECRDISCGSNPTLLSCTFYTKQLCGKRLTGIIAGSVAGGCLVILAVLALLLWLSMSGRRKTYGDDDYVSL